MAKLVINQHPAERVLRVAIGLGLLAIASAGRSPLGYLGLIPLATGAVGWCPAYAALGVSTRPAGDD
jgi:hypothetical protein